jgi:hemoglobin-like flavoprotein
LGAKDVAWAIKTEHRDVFRRAMLDTIAEILARYKFAPLVAEAWSATIDVIFGLMKSEARATKAARY